MHQPELVHLFEGGVRVQGPKALLFLGKYIQCLFLAHLNNEPEFTYYIYMVAPFSIFYFRGNGNLGALYNLSFI